MTAGQPSGAFDLGVRRSRLGAGNVLGDRLVEDNNFLTNESHEITKICRAHVSKVDTVDLDRPGSRVIKPQQQIHQRAFAGTIFAGNAKSHSAVAFKVDPLEHGSRFVSEAHIAKSYGG